MARVYLTREDRAKHNLIRAIKEELDDRELKQKVLAKAVGWKEANTSLKLKNCNITFTELVKIYDFLELDLERILSK